MYEYKVWYRAGYIDNEPVTGFVELDTYEQAIETFTEYFNQLHGDGGVALNKGTAQVILYHRGDIILNTAAEAARL